MSKLFKMGLVPKWGNGVGHIKTFLASQRFQDALSVIRRKKMFVPTTDVSKEIRSLLEEKNDLG